ncbi:MAG: type VI secretion system baseplate subunit TssK, partial [Planctomycetales bacterium]|nr:type VI secretion system baseplate subunit TssK [Planctomycetales bacterium]
FEIASLQARLPDGTLVDLAPGEEPDRLGLTAALQNAKADLAEAFERQAVVRVYLATPKMRLGRRNVTDGAERESRFVSVDSSLQDESMGGGDQDVQLKRLNVQLLLSTDDSAGYETLPIAQIKRAGSSEAAPQLDESYVPPVIVIDAWDGLRRGVIRAVFDLIGQKVEVLSRQVKNRGIGLESRHPGDSDRILMLAQLNAATGTLSQLAFSRGVHPFAAYGELCRIAGSLAIFDEERRSEPFLPYDHEDLAAIFLDVKRRIEKSINAVRHYEFEQRPFVGVGLGMQTSLESAWLHPSWQWFIGVRKGELSERECLDMLAPGALDWKFGSSRQVDLLFRRRAAGLQIVRLDRSVRALPADGEWLYYEVQRDDSPAWRDVQESGTLAMRLQDSMITNQDELQGRE